MSRAPFQLAPLDAAHDRAAFRSDSEPLDRYLREQVTQDIRRRVAACFVAFQKKTEKASMTDVELAAKRYRDLLKELDK